MEKSIETQKVSSPQLAGKYIKPAVTVEDSFHHFRVKMWLHASVACTQIWLVSQFRLDQVTLNIPELCCCALEDFPWCTEHRSPCFYSTAAFVFCSLCFWCFVTLGFFLSYFVSLCVVFASSGLFCLLASVYGALWQFFKVILWSFDASSQLVFQSVNTLHLWATTFECRLIARFAWWEATSLQTVAVSTAIRRAKNH